MREQLIEHLRRAARPLVDDFVDQVVTVIATHVSGSWESATAAALEQLRSALVEPKPVVPQRRKPKRTKRRARAVAPVDEIQPARAKVVQAARKSATRQAEPVDEKPAPASKVVHRDIKPANMPKPAGVHGCGTCGQVGHNARSCGRAPKGPGGRPRGSMTKPAAIKATASDAEEEPRAVPVVTVDPPPKKRGPKPRLEESPVIPHTALVAMLHADRMNNAVGDAGGMVVRADREPSLVGHAETRREFCAEHGWVGRVAFERDRHDLCADAAAVCAPDEPDDVSSIGGVEAEPTLVAVPGYALVWSDDSQNSRRVAPRSETIAVKALTRATLAAGAIEVELAGPPVDERRPQTRSECKNGPRPCPWVSCRHHLFLDVDPERGSIKLNFAGHEPDEMIESCSLDIADRGSHVLENVANLLNVTRERARQLEVRAFNAMRGKAMDDGITSEDAAETGADNTESA